MGRISCAGRASVAEAGTGVAHAGTGVAEAGTGVAEVGTDVVVVDEVVPLKRRVSVQWPR